MILDNPRFNLTYEESSGSELAITLTISGVQEIDAAQYQCQVIVGINNKVNKSVSYIY